MIGNGTQSTGAFIRYAYEDWGLTSGTSGYRIVGNFKSSRVVPIVRNHLEIIPVSQTLSMLIRIA